VNTTSENDSRGLISELDEMWSYVGKKAEPRWLWHAIDHHSGTVLAYVFGRRTDEVFLQLHELIEYFILEYFIPKNEAPTSAIVPPNNTPLAKPIHRGSKASTSMCAPG
jgi:IS1 transposase